MATIYAIRGLLLEEVLLNLLSASGYITVKNADNDKTLEERSKGCLEVKGRGSNHQIDAIADFSVSPPFSNPVRLLLEAKFYRKQSVGIDVVRNAVGVLKDVNEFWVVDSSGVYKPRYHYQYAVFTSSYFTKPAQSYAFAQDIYLIKLENNRYFHPIIEALAHLDCTDFRGSSNKNITISEIDLRQEIRLSLKRKSERTIENYCNAHGFNTEKLCNIVRLSTAIGTSYLGVLGNCFPVFLTPSQHFNIDHLIDDPMIRIYWDNEKWYIVKKHATCHCLSEEDIIFSFDLPSDLFKLYSDKNMLSSRRALNLKEEFMSSIKVMFRDTNRGLIASLELKLDSDWLQNMREHL